VRIRVVDTTLPEPVPAPPASVFVTFTAGDLVFAAGSLSWNPSNFADTYRVYRRDDGAAGGAEGDVSYQPNIQSALHRLVNAVRHWIGQVVSPIARVFNIPVGYASTFEEGTINPSGSYVEIAMPPVNDSSCGTRCAFSDLNAPVSRHLCYAVKACNEAGCSGFSAPACGDAPPPNTLPTVTFVQPAVSGQRIPLGEPFTFRAQLAEVDAGDYIASYRWKVDGVDLPVVTGNFGSSETVDLTRTFSSAGIHTVSIHVTDSNGASPSPDPSTQVDAQPNAAPNACIINPEGSEPPPAWCTS
jgi:hypothetical protein